MVRLFCFVILEKSVIKIKCSVSERILIKLMKRDDGRNFTLAYAYFKTSTGIISKHLQVSFQNICRYYFKTFAGIISKHLQVLFQNIYRYFFQNIYRYHFETSTGIISKHLQVLFQNSCRYYFKTSTGIISKHPLVLFLSTIFEECFYFWGLLGRSVNLWSACVCFRCCRRQTARRCQTFNHLVLLLLSVYLASNSCWLRCISAVFSPLLNLHQCFTADVCVFVRRVLSDNTGTTTCSRPSMGPTHLFSHPTVSPHIRMPPFCTTIRLCVLPMR